MPFFGDDWPIVDMSVWRGIGSLTAFVYTGRHRESLKRRHEWFERIDEAMATLWWVEAGHRPTVAEAEERLLHLREHGPAPYAFSLRRIFGPPLEGWAAVLGHEPVRQSSAHPSNRGRAED